MKLTQCQAMKAGERIQDRISAAVRRATHEHDHESGDAAHRWTFPDGSLLITVLVSECKSPTCEVHAQARELAGAEKGESSCRGEN